MCQGVDNVASHDTHRDMSRGGFANNQGPFDPRVKPYKTTPDKVDIPEWLVDTPGLRQELVEYYECELPDLLVELPRGG